MRSMFSLLMCMGALSSDITFVFFYIHIKHRGVYLFGLQWLVLAVFIADIRGIKMPPANLIMVKKLSVHLYAIMAPT